MADVAAAPEKKEDLFGIVAEVDGRQKQLVLLNLSFGRLIDEIVVPYEEVSWKLSAGWQEANTKSRRHTVTSTKHDSNMSCELTPKM